jgi:hypothetical protein
MMQKGTRVRVVSGRKSKGVEGAVFWEGPNKYGEGTRLGIKDDDDETHWVNAEHVEVIAAAPGAEEAEAAAAEVDESKMQKGARVRWGDGNTGVIFWVGPNKYGPGLRLGVTSDAGGKVWLDAATVEVEEG